MMPPDAQRFAECERFSATSYSKGCILLLPIVFPEEVPRIPPWPLGILGHQISKQKTEACVFGTRLEIKWLIHIVLRGVVDGIEPLQQDLHRFDVRIARLQSEVRPDRRNALLHKGVLIAANKKHLFRKGIRAHGKIQT